MIEPELHQLELELHVATADLFPHDAQIANLRKQHDAAGLDLWNHVKRVRTGVKSVLGDNSSKYEVVGGICIGDRKPRSRKKEEEVAWQGRDRSDRPLDHQGREGLTTEYDGTWRLPRGEKLQKSLLF